MAQERIPNDPYRDRPSDLYRPRNPSRADDPYRTTRRADSGETEARRAARLDNELQMDPELAEGPAGGSRIAIFALGIAVIVGVVLYGLNSAPVNEAGTSSTAQTAAPVNAPPPTAQNAAPPPAQPAAPRANTQPGVTTGSAPAQPQAGPSPAPAGNAPASK